MDQPHPKAHRVADDSKVVEGELIEAKKDHPIWGFLMLLVVCATALVSVQMITGYHW